MGGKIKGGRVQTVPGREWGVGLPGTEMVEGELDEREKVRPAIRGERGMARREDSDNMVFGGADAALRGKGTMIVGGNILIGKERRFKKLDNVTLYCTKLKNPTRMAVMATALDLGIN